MTGLAAKVAVPAVVQAVPWKLIFDFSIALAFLAVLAWGLRVNDLRGRWLHQYQSEHAARANDLKVYRQAQTDATAANKAHVQQIEQKYQRNSDDERQAYLRDLAQLRAQRVRPPVAAPQGSAGPASPPAPDASAPRIDEAGLCVPATSDVCEAGAEIELRLMHLQNLYEQQSSIDPNTGASAK